MYSEGRLTRSRARSQGVGNFEELPLTASKVRSTSRKAPGRPAFLDVTAETENALISEESTSLVKNLSEEFAPTQVLPEIPETDHRASSLAEADIDVSSQGGPAQVLLPDTELQHSPAEESKTGMVNVASDAAAAYEDTDSLVIDEPSLGASATADHGQWSTPLSPHTSSAAPKLAITPGNPGSTSAPKVPATVVAKQPDAGHITADSLSPRAAKATPSAPAASPPTASVFLHTEAAAASPAEAPFTSSGVSTAASPLPAMPYSPAVTVTASPAAAMAFSPAVNVPASPAAAMAHSPALTVTASPTVAAVPFVSPAEAPNTSSAMSTVVEPAAAMADLPPDTVTASPAVAAVPFGSPAEAPSTSSALSRAVTPVAAVANQPAMAVTASPAVAAMPFAVCAKAPITSSTPSPAVTPASMAYSPAMATSAQRSAPKGSSTLPTAASPAMAWAPSPANAAPAVGSDDSKAVTPAAPGVLAAVYFNDTDSESGDNDMLQTDVFAKLNTTPGETLAAAQQASPHLGGVVDSVYDDESDGDIDAMLSQPRRTSKAGLPDVKTAMVQQNSHLPQHSVLPKVLDPASVTNEMLHAEAGDSPAGTWASETESAGRVHTADQLIHPEDGFDRWEMDTGMDASEDNMYLGQVSSSRLGSQVHASPSYDPRSLRQLRKEVANKLAQAAAAKAQAKAEAVPLPRTPAGLYDSQSDADMSPSPYQQPPKKHTEEDEKLCNALGSLDIQSASKSRQPLRGLPVPQGVHIRFGDEGQAVPSPSATQIKLRGVPAPRNSHIRFD